MRAILPHHRIEGHSNQKHSFVCSHCTNIRLWDKCSRVLAHQVKCNLRNISYHIDQYTSIITDLHREIERLKERVKNQEKEKSTVSTDLGDLQGRARNKNCSGASGGKGAGRGAVWMCCGSTWWASMQM